MLGVDLVRETIECLTWAGVFIAPILLSFVPDDVIWAGSTPICWSPSEYRVAVASPSFASHGALTHLTPYPFTRN